MSNCNKLNKVNKTNEVVDRNAKLVLLVIKEKLEFPPRNNSLTCNSTKTVYCFVFPLVENLFSKTLHSTTCALN